jgi:uncharacterized protein YbaP (TraB family)
MIRPVLAFVSLVFFAVAPAVAQDLPYSKGRLWMVEAPDAPPSWLVGTMHSADPEVTTLWPALAQVVNTADKLAVEVILDEAALGIMGQSMVLNDGRTLAEIAGPERMARIQAAGAKYGLPPDALMYLKPWAVFMTYSVPPSEYIRQARGEAALDGILQQLAEDRGMPIYGIETVREQIAVFASYSEADQLALLDIALDLHSGAEAEMAWMKQAWRAGDLGALYDRATEPPYSGSLELINDFMSRLLLDRNYRMAERMMPLLDQGNALIAIGALHLPGEEGVLAILEDRGYQVSPME